MSKRFQNNGLPGYPVCSCFWCPFRKFLIFAFYGLPDNITKGNRSATFLTSHGSWILAISQDHPKIHLVRLQVMCTCIWTDSGWTTGSYGRGLGQRGMAAPKEVSVDATLVSVTSELESFLHLRKIEELSLHPSDWVWLTHGSSNHLPGIFFLNGPALFQTNNGFSAGMCTGSG